MFDGKGDYSNIYDEGPVAGVALSVPLDSHSHVLDHRPASDASRSWSTCSSIHLANVSGIYSVSVDVYNLGPTAGLVYLDLILWFIRADGTRESRLVSHEYNLMIPGTVPGHAATSISTRAKQIPSFPALTLTHIYAVAYDPMFDHPDRWTQALMSASAPDFSFNPARLSRQIGCLNVYYADNGYGFELDWVFRGTIGVLNPSIANHSRAPADVCIRKVDGVLHRSALWNDNLRLEPVRDLRFSVGQLFSFGETHLAEIACDIALVSQNPRCDPNCSQGNPNDYVGQVICFMWNDGVVLDGRHSGTGNIIDIEEFEIDVPWSVGVQQSVSLRFLLR